MNVLHRLHCNTKLLIVTMVVAALCVGYSTSDCPPRDPNDGTVTSYVVINEPYDRNYSEMGSGKFPLGFHSSIWQYNQGSANPCIRISAPNASDSQLEIKVETYPSARLCVKDQQSTIQCFEETHSDCRETPGNDIYVEFLCDSQCGEHDVNFWYRLVLSPPGAVDWCLGRDNQFPSSLITIPPGMTLPTITTPSPRD